MVTSDEEEEWYQIERSYMLFLLTVDNLYLSPTLSAMLRAPVPGSVYNFLSRFKQTIRPVKVILSEEDI